MALFSKKSKVVVCEMCGRADVEGCGSANRHVVAIRGEEPEWLPPDLRAQAQGEYTWLCLHCNSFPSIKWPSDSGAWAGIMMHLGSAHSKGHMQGMGRPPFSMIQLGR